ncbi:MAG: hypothetical protein MUP15_08670 [Dehalococcoidia bacterium]|nr:hypothetical protein [Dehalococcoidia bacterium]
MSRKIMLLAGVVLIAAMVTSGTAFAAKGGGGRKPGPGGGANVGTCVVAPNPVAVGANLIIQGSKYAPGEGLVVKLTNSGGTTFRWTTADAKGSFVMTWWTYAAGANTVNIYDTARSTFLSSCPFTAY